MKIHKFKLRYIFSLLSILDFLIIIAIFIRLFYTDNTILHILTSLKIFRAYRITHDLAKVNNFFRDNKDLLISSINLLIFTFLMASIVFIGQSNNNDQINTFVDALYFTISTLTTTGFGDITASGDEGKLLVILIMIFGTGLFLRLITVVFRPRKKTYKCKHCGLSRHERDASHCKHCGKIIYLENSGALD